MARTCMLLGALSVEVTAVFGGHEAGDRQGAPPKLALPLHRRWHRLRDRVHRLQASIMLALHEATVRSLSIQLEAVLAEEVANWRPGDVEDGTAQGGDRCSVDDEFVMLVASQADTLVGKIESEVDALQQAKSSGHLRPYLRFMPRGGRQLKDLVAELERIDAVALVKARQYDLRFVLGTAERRLALLQQQCNELQESDAAIHAVDRLKALAKVGNSCVRPVHLPSTRKHQRTSS